MKKEQLFTGSKASSKGVTEVAEFAWSSPLGSYVLDTLPIDLTAVEDGRMTYGQLAEKHDGVLSALGADALVVDDLPQACAIQLDLLFMRGGFLPAGPHIAPAP